MEEIISPKNTKIEFKYNQKREHILCGVYGKNSKSIQMLNNKST